MTAAPRTGSKARSERRERRLPEVFHASQMDIEEMMATAMAVNCRLRFQIRSLISMEILIGSIIFQRCPLMAVLPYRVTRRGSHPGAAAAWQAETKRL